jgi:hypothetical protein
MCSAFLLGASCFGANIRGKRGRNRLLCRQIGRVHTGLGALEINIVYPGFGGPPGRVLARAWRLLPRAGSDEWHLVGQFPLSPFSGARCEINGCYALHVRPSMLNTMASVLARLVRRPGPLSTFSRSIGSCYGAQRLRGFVRRLGAFAACPICFGRQLAERLLGFAWVLGHSLQCCQLSDHYSDYYSGQFPAIGSRALPGARWPSPLHGRGSRYAGQPHSSGLVAYLVPSALHGKRNGPGLLPRHQQGSQKRL